MQTNRTILRSERAVRADIRNAKRILDGCLRGTPERETAFTNYCNLQKELGAIELRKLGIEPCAS